MNNINLIMYRDVEKLEGRGAYIGLLTHIEGVSTMHCWRSTYTPSHKQTPSNSTTTSVVTGLEPMYLL